MSRSTCLYTSPKARPIPARGAGSYKDGARLLYTISPMSKDDAKLYGVSEEERRLIRRIDDAKVNITRPEGPRWFRLVDVPIGNATETYPLGDHVQTVEPWQPPGLFADISDEIARTIMAEIDQGTDDGRPYSNHSNAEGRAAWPVVTRHLPDRNETQARAIIKTWVTTEALRVVKGLWDPKDRQKVTGLKLNPINQPGNQWE